MHPEADAFLDAIFDHPDDDTPRLVYADWLQEHGQEDYAQFIRLQCAVAREKLWSDEANRLWEEIGRVWNRLDEEWWPATREAWYEGDREPRLLDAVHFERGILRSSVGATAELMFQIAVLDLNIAPIQTLLLNGEDDALVAVAESPVLERVTSIRFASDYRFWPTRTPSESSVDTLLYSRYLRRVTALDLSPFSLTQLLLDTLLNAPNLALLEEAVVWFGDETDCDEEEAIRKLKGRFTRVIHN
jgi:uncharacterized protein (TIGR02996 family)